VAEILGTKHAIGGNQFTIQYLHQTGHVSMNKAHSHPTYELYYVLNGGRVFFINETVYTAQKGDLILIYPNDIHRTTSSEALKCERILINFSESFLDVELSRCPILLKPEYAGAPFIRFPIDIQASVEELLLKLLHECEAMQLAYETYVRSLLMELLVLMYRYSVKASVKQHPSNHPMHNKINEIAAYLNEHFQENVSLQEVAALFYISPSYLSRIFKKITGFKFTEYVQIIRLREAKRLLRESKEPISMIAHKTGFEHPAHFNVMFKKATGVTPGQYRKNFRQYNDGGAYEP
jgi:AraC family transcriptional regulator, arabinose operon regulatory protein